MYIEEQLALILAAVQRTEYALKAIADHAGPTPSNANAAIPQPPAPTAQPVTAAPSTAVVPPVPTAPAEASVISPTTAFAQNAQTPAVPAVPAALPTTARAADVELDTKGIPWDPRIHAGTKGKLANGEWRTKRGADPNLVAKVESELKANMSTPSLPGMPMPPATAATPAAPPAQAGGIDFNRLIMTLPGMVATGAITTEQIEVACQSVGLSGIAALGARQDLVPAVALALGVFP